MKQKEYKLVKLTNLVTNDTTYRVDKYLNVEYEPVDGDYCSDGCSILEYINLNVWLPLKEFGSEDAAKEFLQSEINRRKYIEELEIFTI